MSFQYRCSLDVVTIPKPEEEAPKEEHEKVVVEEEHRGTADKQFSE